MTPGIIISIVGLVISVFSFFGLGLWFQHAWNKHFREIDKKEADAKELNYRRNEEKIAEIIDEKLAPVKDDIRHFSEQLTVQQQEIQAGLRNDLIAVYHECKQNKCRSETDTKNYYDMLEAYHKLGGNSYIKDVTKEFEEIPLK